MPYLDGTLSHRRFDTLPARLRLSFGGVAVDPRSESCRSRPTIKGIVGSLLESGLVQRAPRCGFTEPVDEHGRTSPRRSARLMPRAVGETLSRRFLTWPVDVLIRAHVRCPSRRSLEDRRGQPRLRGNLYGDADADRRGDGRRCRSLLGRRRPIRGCAYSCEL